MSDPVWQLNDISLCSGQTARLSGIDLQIGPGVTAVLGASGAGKSSLLSLLAGFERPTSGTMVFVARPSVGQLPLFWSPQDHGLWPKMTVREHIATVMPDQSRMERSVDDWLKLLRLDAVTGALPQRLSQGERSRLSLGRALASEAACLVLDEPLAHIDPIHCRSYLDLIADHAKTLSVTVVFSTHDPASVLRIAEQVICLSESRCVFNGPVNELYFNPPTEETAWLLGPANWCDRDNATLWELIGNDLPICVRPHELVVVDAGRLAVSENVSQRLELVEVNRAGGLSELLISDVSGETRRLRSTRCPESVAPGSQVRMRFESDAERTTARAC